MRENSEVPNFYEETVKEVDRHRGCNFDDLVQTGDEGGAYEYCEKHDADVSSAIEWEMEKDNDHFLGGLSAREQYYREVSKIPLLSPEEEREIAKRCKEGDQAARNKLIESNLRLVGFVAKRYLNYSADYDDILAQGNLGLMQAVDRFDYEKGYKFSTYAFWWIRRSIVKYIADQGYPIPITEKGHRDIMSIKKAIDEFIATHDDRNPTLEELAEITGESAERIQNLMRATTLPISLYAPSHKYGNSLVGESIPDQQMSSPALNAENQETYDLIVQALSKLPRKERFIIELRFGLVDGQDRKLEEIGREFRLTRERVRQIEDRGLAKLQHPLEELQDRAP